MSNNAAPNPNLPRYCKNFKAMKEETLLKIDALSSRIAEVHEEGKEALRVLNTIHAKRDRLISEKRKATQSLSVLAPYKVGDKVTVHKAYLKGAVWLGNWQPRDGFISKILVMVKERGELGFYYKINKVKKDGTMSSQAIRYKSDEYMASEFTKID